MGARPRPVRILAGVGAAATAVTGALALIPGVPGWLPPSFAVLGLGLTVFVGKYTEDQVTPLDSPRDAAGRQLVPLRNTAFGGEGHIHTSGGPFYPECPVCNPLTLPDPGRPSP